MSGLRTILRRLPQAVKAFRNTLNPPPQGSTPDPWEVRLDELTREHRALKKEVSAVVYARNKILSRLEELRRMKQDIETQLITPSSRLDLTDELGMFVRKPTQLLRARQAQTNNEIALLEETYPEIYGVAERLKDGLIALQQEMQRVKDQRERVNIRESIARATVILNECERKGLI